MKLSHFFALAVALFSPVVLGVPQPMNGGGSEAEYQARGTVTLGMRIDAEMKFKQLYNVARWEIDKGPSEESIVKAVKALMAADNLASIHPSGAQDFIKSIEKELDPEGPAYNFMTEIISALNKGSRWHPATSRGHPASMVGASTSRGPPDQRQTEHA